MHAADLDLEAKVLSRKSPNGPWRWVVLVAVGVALAIWWWLAATGQSAQSYVSETVGRGDVTVVVTATGTVEPTNLVGISSALSGTVESVAVDFNDTVTKGQELARLDTHKLKASLEHSRAMLAAAEARLALAKTTLVDAKRSYERAERLAERGVITLEAFQGTDSVYQRAEATVASAEADLRVSQADLSVNEANLADACICSPIDGIVLNRSIDVGQIVVSSFQAPVLFTLAEDLRKMELRVDIDEADIGKVKVDDLASFTVEAFNDRSFAAKMTQLRFAPKTIDGVVTYEAILSLDNSEGLLRPGMTAVAEIVVHQVKAVLLVPNAALRYAPESDAEAGRASGSGLIGMLFPRPPSLAPVSRSEEVSGTREIWVLRDGVAVAVSIVPGASDGRVSEVRSGDLAEGDAVITDVVAVP